MTDTLVIRFTSDVAAVERALPPDTSRINITTLSQLPLRRRRLERFGMFHRIVLVGSPPHAGIGFGFVPLVAAVLRPRTILTVEATTGRRRERSVWRYVGLTALPAALQIAASMAAIPVQMLLAGLVRAQRPELRSASKLRRLLYLRPLVGMSTPVGGSVTHTHEVIRAIGELGIKVDAITTDPGVVATATNDPEPPCRWRLSRVPWLLRALPVSFALGGDLALLVASLRHARRADVVYQRQTRFALAGALLSRVLHRPLFLEYNSPSDFFRTGRRAPLTRVRDACERAALASATCVVVVSEVARRQVAALGIPDERIIVNPNGVVADRFRYGGGAEFRRERGIRDDEIVFGFVGSFGPWHGAPVLARAFDRVVSAVPAARLLLAGDGDELGEVLETLEDLVVSGRVLSEGRVAPDRIPTILDSCDVLVSPHVPLAGGVEFFGSPTKLFEYMAAGKAIVASALGQIADVLEDGRSAVLVTPGDEDDLVAGLLKVAADGEFRARLGAAARRDAKSKYSWRRNAERIADAYANIAPAIARSTSVVSDEE
jgi:glycosyltransferase involved in cell wall biosynthesis